MLAHSVVIADNHTDVAGDVSSGAKGTWRCGTTMDVAIVLDLCADDFRWHHTDRIRKDVFCGQVASGNNLLSVPSYVFPSHIPHRYCNGFA